MLKLQKSSLILILIIVVLTAGCVSIYTLGYTPGTVWHKAEDVKSGTFGQNVGGSNYNFPGKVGIKKTNPSSELDVTGDIYATGQVIAGNKFKVGVSEMSSGKITGLDRPTSANDATSKGYVDEQIAEVRAIVTGAQPLVYGAHTQQDCINAGGEVVDSDVTFKQCRFERSTCPPSWSQYKNFSTTIATRCQSGIWDETNQQWLRRCYGETFGGHEWQDAPPETSKYEAVKFEDIYTTPYHYVCGTAYYKSSELESHDCIARDSYTCICYATITQIGCY